MFHKNIGKIDKIIRITIGLLFLCLGYYYHTYWGLIGILPILTVTVSFCPLYAILGIHTCPMDEKETTSSPEMPAPKI